MKILIYWLIILKMEAFFISIKLIAYDKHDSKNQSELTLWILTAKKSAQMFFLQLLEF